MITGMQWRGLPGEQPDAADHQRWSQALYKNNSPQGEYNMRMSIAQQPADNACQHNQNTDLQQLNLQYVPQGIIRDHHFPAQPDREEFEFAVFRRR